MGALSSSGEFRRLPAVLRLADWRTGLASLGEQWSLPKKRICEDWTYDQVVTQVKHRRQSNYYTFFTEGNYFLRRSCLQKQTVWARIGHTIITAIALSFLTFWIPCGVDFFAFFLSLTGFPATTFVVIRHLSKRWINYKKGNNSLKKKHTIANAPLISPLVYRCSQMSRATRSYQITKTYKVEKRTYVIHYNSHSP